MVQTVSRRGVLGFDGVIVEYAVLPVVILFPVRNRFNVFVRVMVVKNAWEGVHADSAKGLGRS